MTEGIDHIEYHQVGTDGRPVVIPGENEGDQECRPEYGDVDEVLLEVLNKTSRRKSFNRHMVEAVHILHDRGKVQAQVGSIVKRLDD